MSEGDTGISRVWRTAVETKILLWKTYLVLSRHQISVWAQVVTPFLLCVYILMVQSMIHSLLLKFIDPNPPSTASNSVPACWGAHCATVGVAYSHGETQWTQHVLAHMAETQHLELGKDIVTIATDGYTDAMEYLSTFPNKTQAVVFFCTGIIKLPKVEGGLLPRTFSCEGDHLMIYSMIYNFTSATMPVFIKPDEQSPIDRSILPLKVAIDNGILDYKRKLKGLPKISIELEVADFPHMKNRFIDGYDTVTMQGPLYFFLPPMIIFIMVMSEMVREKEQRLREVLNTLGISQVAFWASWVITSFFFSFFISNLTAIAGRAIGFDFFTKSPYWYGLLRCVFLIFFTFTNTMISFGFFLVTVLSSGKMTYTVSYSLLLAGLVIQLFISSHLLIICLYIVDLPWWFVYVRIGLSLYPPFHFATAFYEVSRLSSSHPLYAERRWAPGEGYTWSHFYQRQEGWLQGHKFITPSLYDSLIALCGDLLFFAFLTWVCDHTVASNRGVAEPVYFMFTRKYWGCGGKRRQTHSALEAVEMQEIESSSVVIDSPPQHPAPSGSGVQIRDIGKVYRKYPFGISSPEDVQALKGVSFSAEKNEVLALLGHNGAGKSTLLSILSGTLAPTSGSAVICGEEITDSMEVIRHRMGFCPQHSLLWDELTAEEHIYLFARLKGMNDLQAKNTCADTLREVELEQVAKAQVGTFSGGMRRRMSIALAGTGNPDVILMDEPTTGLDPISRSQVWKLIQRIKRNRVVILTTHAMDEADALSDRIAILSNGALQCIGSSLRLKSTYGQGYRVSLISSPGDSILSLIQSKVPTAEVVDESADSLIVALPKDDLKAITAFFELIEDVPNMLSGSSSSSHDSSAFTLEQESSKLQAEVHKLSQELEDLMTSRHVSEGKSEAFGRFQSVGEATSEDSDSGHENSFSPSKSLRKSRFSPLATMNPLLDDGNSPVNAMQGAEVCSPAFSTAPKGTLFTPDPGQFSSFASGSLSKSQRASVGWRRVNEGLRSLGVPQVPGFSESAGELTPENCLDALTALLWEVEKTRTECQVRSKQNRERTAGSERDAAKEELRRVRTKWEEERTMRQDERFEMDKQIRELERERATLIGRLETAQMQLRQRDQLISELKSQHPPDPPAPDLPHSTDRDRLIFQNYFKREPKTLSDAKVLGLIHAYEEVRRRAMSSPRPQEPERKGPKTGVVLTQVLGLLELKSEAELLSAVEKMLKVIRAVPTLESFIRTVSAEVIENTNASVDDVVPTIRLWKTRAKQWAELEECRAALCEVLRIDGKASAAEVVSLRQKRRVRECVKESRSSYFRKLFEVDSDEDTKQSVNQVFLFVHEMKTLLQYSREVLRIDSSEPVQSVVAAIKHKLQS